MMPLALVITFTFLLIIVGVSSFTKYVRPGLKRMKKDTLALREELHKSGAELVEMDKDELELLSSKISKESVSNRLMRKRKGYISSIYDEKLIAYVVKRYFSDKRTLVYARTKTDEFVYIHKNEITQLYLNGKPIAFLQNGKMFQIGSDNKLLGRLVDSDSGLKGLQVGDRELAILNPRVEKSPVKTRAFKFLGPLNSSQKKIVIAFLIYQLLIDKR